MAYEAIVARVHTRPHPNADRLLLGTVAGSQVVVGKDTVDGELGVFFPTDGQLSPDMCAANNLYSEVALTKLMEQEIIKGWRANVTDGPAKFGFFSDKRRVRAQSFRGEKSDGFWCPLSYFKWTGAVVDVIGDYRPGDGDQFVLKGLNEGDTFTELNGLPICNKYETQATRNARSSAKIGKRQHDNKCFPKHSDTVQFRFVADKIPADAVCYITEKLHGTSGRYGLVLDDRDLQPWHGFVNRMLRRMGLSPLFAEREYRYLNGSRNVILEKSVGGGYYGSNEFRHRAVENLTLRKGEVIYFEIVGSIPRSVLTDTMRTECRYIMDPQPVKEELKHLSKQYGPMMVYKYGCAEAEQKMFVYKIISMNEDGEGVELSWPQMVRRCGELGLQTVPLLKGPFTPHLLTDTDHPDEAKERLTTIVQYFTEGASTLDSSHIREGVVLRVESAEGTQHIKNKSWTFGVLEGYIKDLDTYVDTEEAA